jgi:putative ATP-binding cassette transporter
MLKFKVKDILFIILFAIPNTLLSFGTLYIINNAISGKEEFLKDYMWIVFLSIIVYSYLLNIYFQKRLNRYAFSVLYENEKNIFEKILNTPLITLEKLGSQRFYTTIQDIRVFGSFSQIVTHTVNSLLMLTLCIVYMFTISTYSALIVLGLITVLASVFFIVINTMSKQLSILRKYNESYFSYVNDVIKGFKQLKADSRKRENLMNKHLIPNRETSRGMDYKINFVFLSINLISQYGLYLVIGVILFLLPSLHLLSREEVIPYVVILLFISGPINNLINMQNVYSQYIVSNSRIRKFLEDFHNSDATTEFTEEKSHVDFRSLEAHDICFYYDDPGSENGFALGPINFKIEQGEVIFIIGGNGCGKTTFINILTGLYRPSQGELILNGERNAHQHANTQNLVSAIFTDNHIFSNNYDDYSLTGNKLYPELLKMMEMDKVVTDDQEESARRPFSKGQGKRMAMIFSLLEDKPILILDEWAADQDPHFRKYFYEHLLPELKRKGKTIIAVTHDDAYFKHADRIIKFDYGKIVKEFKPEEAHTFADELWQREVVH